MKAIKNIRRFLSRVKAGGQKRAKKELKRRYPEAGDFPTDKYYHGWEHEWKKEMKPTGKKSEKYPEGKLEEHRTPTWKKVGAAGGVGGAGAMGYTIGGEGDKAHEAKERNLRELRKPVQKEQIKRINRLKYVGQAKQGIQVKGRKTKRIPGPYSGTSARERMTRENFVKKYARNDREARRMLDQWESRNRDLLKANRGQQEQFIKEEQTGKAGADLRKTLAGKENIKAGLHHRSQKQLEGWDPATGKGESKQLTRGSMTDKQGRQLKALTLAGLDRDPNTKHIADKIRKGGTQSLSDADKDMYQKVTSKNFEGMSNRRQGQIAGQKTKEGRAMRGREAALRNQKEDIVGELRNEHPGWSEAKLRLRASAEMKTVQSSARSMASAVPITDKGARDKDMGGLTTSKTLRSRSRRTGTRLPDEAKATREPKGLPFDPKAVKRNMYKVLDKDTKRVVNLPTREKQSSGGERAIQQASGVEAAINERNKRLRHGAAVKARKARQQKRIVDRATQSEIRKAVSEGKVPPAGETRKAKRRVTKGHPLQIDEKNYGQPQRIKIAGDWENIGGLPMGPGVPIAGAKVARDQARDRAISKSRARGQTKRKQEIAGKKATEKKHQQQAAGHHGVSRRFDVKDPLPPERTRQRGRSRNRPTRDFSALNNLIEFRHKEKKGTKRVLGGAAIGAAVGAEKGRHYLRDVKLRHKQLRRHAAYGGGEDYATGGKEVAPGLPKTDPSDRRNPRLRDWAKGKVPLYDPRHRPEGFWRATKGKAILKALGLTAGGALAGAAYHGIKTARERRRQRA